MPEMRRAVADPNAVYAERVASKTVIYLDTNAWSDLAEGKLADAREARTLALEAVASQRAVFPLAFPTITEMLRRGVNSDSVAQAELMDVLSAGVAFRGPKQIRELEVRAACDLLLSGKSTPPVASVFTITPCYISDTTVVFPEGWTESGADDFIKKLKESGVPGMRWLQNHMRKPEYLEHNATTDQKYVREVSRKRVDALAWSADRSGKPNPASLRKEEHQAVLNNYIYGHLLRVTSPDEFVRLVPELNGLQDDAKELRRVVGAMPSTWLSCEMHVQVILAKTRQTTTQDWYDHESAVLAVPYTDAFVTSDGGVLDLLRRARASKKFNCRLLRGMTALRSCLESTLAS